MESRAGFKTLTEQELRNPTGSDTGIIPTPVTSQTTNGATIKGIETNTARGVKQAVVLTGITPVEYAASTDAPAVEGFKVYGSY